MEIGDRVTVKLTQRTGIIVEIQKSLLKRNIYLVQESKYTCNGYFGEELQLNNYKGANNHDKQ